MNETPTPKEQEQLQAVTIMGNHYSVRVSVNDANVSPPGSDVEDNEDMMMMMMMEGSGGGGELELFQVLYTYIFVMCVCVMDSYC